MHKKTKNRVETKKVFVSLPSNGGLDKTLFAQLLRKKFPTNPVRTFFKKSNRRSYFKEVISNAFHGIPINETDARFIAKQLDLNRCQLFAKKGSVMIEITVTVL